MFEFLGIVALFLNDFFANNLVFISHMLAAVFLVLTETTVNMRIVTPVLEGIENTLFGRIPLLPNFITAIFFIMWATLSLFVYQQIFQWLLNRYADHLTLILGVVFVLITVAINIKYRD